VRFGFIKAEKARYPVKVLCGVLGVTKQGFYAWLKRPPSVRGLRDAVDAVLVREAHRRGRKRSGYRRVHAELRRQGHSIGKHRTARLMRSEHLFGVPRRRYRVTTDSTHKLGYAPNRLGRAFSAPKPNVAWLTDITYISTSEGWLYLAAVIDLYSRQVVGWQMSESLHADIAVKALSMALERRQPPKGLMVHSDRGLQFASHAFRQLLDENGCVQSMSRKANCWDNAPMESFFGSLKRELGTSHFSSRNEARTATFEWIEVFYNRERLHSSLGYVSPVEYELQHAA
jgi:putative transposase